MYCTCLREIRPIRSDWFFLVLISFWQMIHCSLQTKTSKKAMLYAGKLHDAVVKFGTYRNSQQHRAVLPAIARLSCLYSCRWCSKQTCARFSVTRLNRSIIFCRCAWVCSSHRVDCSGHPHPFDGELMAPNMNDWWTEEHRVNLQLWRLSIHPSIHPKKLFQATRPIKTVRRDWNSLDILSRSKLIPQPPVDISCC